MSLCSSEQLMLVRGQPRAHTSTRVAQRVSGARHDVSSAAVPARVRVDDELHLAADDAETPARRV